MIMRVGILGGTFNPPHIGHLVLAETAKEKLNLDKVIFVPTNRPPHKKTYLVEGKIRFEMVKLAVEGCPYFEVLDWEIKRGGISYTIDTLRALRKRYPKRDFFLLIGSDLANNFTAWRGYREIRELTTVVAVKRKNLPLRKKGFVTIDIVNIEITSSLLRSYIKKGISVKYLIPQKVLNYIRRHKLYL